jgi:hypothetical protein
MNAPLQYIPMDDARLAVAAIHPIRFFIKYIDNGDGTHKAREMVEWAKKGVTIPATVVEGIERLRKAAERPGLEPDDEAAAKWRAIRPYYDNWKSAGTGEVVNGTPLVTWAGITSDVVEFLRPLRIFSVEDLAQASDSILARVPDPNANRYRERARQFLATKDIAIAVRQLDESKNEIEELKAMVAKLQKAHADSDLKRSEAERELEDVAPGPSRKRKG